MKTDIILQNLIAKRSWRNHRTNEIHVYELDEDDKAKIESIRQLELCGFDPTELTHLGKIHLKNTFDGTKQDYKDLVWKRTVTHYVLEHFPQFYEIRFLSKGVYIR